MGLLYDYSAELDQKYGAIGTLQREAFLDEALEMMRHELGEEEFNKFVELNEVYV